MKEKMVKTGTIDLEPTWESVLNMLQRAGKIDSNTRELLIPACVTMDIIRQAQKNGKKSITFSFPSDREMIHSEDTKWKE